MRFAIMAASVLVLIGVCADAADAGTITLDLAGVVSTAETGNPFGIDVGDLITGSVTYTDTLLPATGPFSHALDSDPGAALEITLGPLSFDETDDVDYLSGFPLLIGADGVPSGLDVMIEFDYAPFSTAGSEFVFQIAGTGFEIFSYSLPDALVTGTLAPVVIQQQSGASAVPLPPAGWLGLGGLALLALLRRRRCSAPAL